MLPPLKNNSRFIPPREDEHDYNSETEQFIQDELDNFPKETDIRDRYEDDSDPDDIRDVL